MNNDVNDLACTGGCGAISKWALTTPAIIQTVSTTEGDVNWGLKFFADQGGTCGVTSTVAVPIAPNNAAAIATAIMGRTAANGGLNNGTQTPTRIAEQAAVSLLLDDHRFESQVHPPRDRRIAQLPARRQRADRRLSRRGHGNRVGPLHRLRHIRRRDRRPGERR